MIAIGVLAWIENDDQLPELKHCLDSVESFYPVIVVNGKWDDIEGENIRSTVQANHLIDSYSNVVHVQSPNKPEWYNRNLCLEIAVKLGYDKLFWLDTDEYVDMPLGKEFFLRGLEFGDKQTCYFHYYDTARGGCCRMVRGINNIDKVYLNKQHNEWWSEGVNIFKDPYKAPRGIIIRCDQTYRTQERKEKMIQRNISNPVH